MFNDLQHTRLCILVPGVCYYWYCHYYAPSVHSTSTRFKPVTAGNCMISEAERHALGAFLRAQRARVQPAAVGLPAGQRRKTPGLRREELAYLAGISVTWYTWIEQGRQVRISDSVLESLARVLRLSAHERAYLFRLATGTTNPPIALPIDPPTSSAHPRSSGRLPGLYYGSILGYRRLEPCGHPRIR